MSKKLLMTVGVIALAGLALGACQKQKRGDVIVGGRALVVSDRLVCPQQVGKLTLVSAAADGQSCAYNGAYAQEITLSRAGGHGQSNDEVLKGVEAALTAIVPSPSEAPAHADTGNTTSAEWGDDEHDEDRKGGKHDHEKANVDLPGLHIRTDGDHAQISLPGVNINAEGDKAHIATNIGKMKNTTIDANDGGAIIRTNMTDAGNTNRTWIVANKVAGSGGYHTVAYIARGPNSGPLVIAQVKSKEEHDHSDFDTWGMGDIRKLIDLSAK